MAQASCNEHGMRASRAAAFPSLHWIQGRWTKFLQVNTYSYAFRSARRSQGLPPPARR